MSIRSGVNMDKSIISERCGRWKRHNGIELAQVLDEMLGPSPLVLDIGAYKGDFFSCILTMRPDARVHAFEPIPRRARKLAKAFNTIDAVTIHPVALGKANTTARLHVARANTLSSLLQATCDGRNRYGKRLEEIDTVDVPVRRLADYIKFADILNENSADLIKIDVQGGELDVLLGAGEMLSSTRIVVIEMSEKTTYQGQALAPQLDSHLEERGFARHGIYESNTPNIVRSGKDAIYVNSNCPLIYATNPSFSGFTLKKAST